MSQPALPWRPCRLPSQYRPQHKITLTICLGPLMRHTCGNQFYPGILPSVVVRHPPPLPLSYESPPFSRHRDESFPGQLISSESPLALSPSRYFFPRIVSSMDGWKWPRCVILISFSDPCRVARVDGSNTMKELNDVLARVWYIFTYFIYLIWLRVL